MLCLVSAGGMQPLCHQSFIGNSMPDSGNTFQSPQRHDGRKQPKSNSLRCAAASPHNP
jgi:hypothetical protein